MICAVLKEKDPFDPELTVSKEKDQMQSDLFMYEENITSPN